MKRFLLAILLLCSVSAHAQLIRLGPTGKQVTGVLAAVNGGTGQSAYTVGDLLYANSTTTLGKLAIGGADTFLQGGAAPHYGSLLLCGDSTHALGYDTVTHAFTCQAITGSGGTVTSVAASFTGGLVSIAGSPITTNGTLAFTVAGTSGGVPYFSSSSTWASSGALTANLPVIGGGAGVAPSVGTRSGNTTQFVTTTGTQTSGDCVKIDANGNHIAQGAACGTGTVTSVAQTFTGGLISVAGSPITTSGTLALTVAGTSGGIPYFSSSSAWASSAALTNHALVLGGGAGAAPSTPVGLGTATTVLHGAAAGDPSFSSVSLTADVSGILPLANGGTNQSSWTANRCVRVNAGGTALEIAALDCTGGPNTYGGIIGGDASSSILYSLNGSFSSATREVFPFNFSVDGPTLCQNAATSTAPPTAVVQWAFGSGFSGASPTALGASTYVDAQGCNGQTAQVFPVSPSSVLTSVNPAVVASATPTLWSANVIGSSHMLFNIPFRTTFATGTTPRYSSVGQTATASTTTTDEQLVELPVSAMTVNGVCYILSSAQPGGGNIVLTLRKNAVDTTNIVTIAASGVIGKYCDNTHSVSYSDGDLLSVSSVNNAGATSGSFNDVIIDATPTASGMTAWIPFPKGNRTLSASTTVYSSAFVNVALNASENGAWAGMPRAGTAKNLRCYVKSAPATNTTVITLYQNGSPTTLTVSVTTGTTANSVVADTTHTVSFAKNDSFSLQYAPGAGAVASISGCGMEFD